MELVDENGIGCGGVVCESMLCMSDATLNGQQIMVEC
jgi:hypothetical protein